MWRRRHKCLNLVDTNRDFCMHRVISSYMRPRPNVVQLPERKYLPILPYFSPTKTRLALSRSIRATSCYLKVRNESRTYLHYHSNGQEIHGAHLGVCSEAHHRHILTQEICCLGKHKYHYFRIWMGLSLKIEKGEMVFLWAPGWGISVSMNLASTVLIQKLGEWIFWYTPQEEQHIGLHGPLVPSTRFWLQHNRYLVYRLNGLGFLSTISFRTSRWSNLATKTRVY